MPTSSTASTPASVGVKRRLKLLLLMVVLFMSWAIYTLIVQQQHTTERSTQLHDVKTKLAEVQSKNDTLKKEITRLNDDEYIGQIARQQGMTRPGERTILIEPKAP
ncbi:FtsB family cell division protein [Cohnella sp. JJ-181]|uniref:FtsB family cell division protein n=1 Tax=Cohnella rhizoplanae TaxID=2974897 RepID=UPI0022FFA164|nr:septum formation initiator family protein [Cohnella sp. JJ-181]CAI6084687.1 Cell division protein FtsL [Cohnella sp. JJ-181]